MKNQLFTILSGLFLLSALLILSCDDREDAFKLVPIANFTVSDSIIDVNSTVQFTDNSIYSPTTRSWNFGDNNISNEKDPSHTYTNAGTYMVRLIVSNEYGSDSTTKNIIVSEAGKAPIASFIVSDSIIIVGQSVTFTDKSANNPNKWLWEFGDGKLSTSQNTSYDYDKPGTYEVKLTATNDFGSSSITKDIKVGTPPVANFSGATEFILTGETVQFTDHSTNSPKSWKWEFGDGNTSIEQNPAYKYIQAGAYTVKLTVKNDFGTDTISKSKYIVVANPVTDYDNNVYKTVTIGDQIWMAENLKTTHYSDGTAIPLVTGNSNWLALSGSEKAYCWYNDDITYKNAYGALYTWAAAMNGAESSELNPSGIQGVCPTGWHLPSEAEILQLYVFLGNQDVGGKLKETDTIHWKSPNTGATNETWFTALPGGSRNPYSGLSEGIREVGFWWCSNDYRGEANVGWLIGLVYDGNTIDGKYDHKDTGISVRCVKD